ncbi:hypothetical protein ACMFMG_011494 [Clarireedia jacksonii]
MATANGRQSQSFEKVNEYTSHEKASGNLNLYGGSGGLSYSRSAPTNHVAADNSQWLAQPTTDGAPSVGTGVLQDVSQSKEYTSDITNMVATRDSGGILLNYADYASCSTPGWSMIVHTDAQSTPGVFPGSTRNVIKKTGSKGEAERGLLMKHDLLGLGAQFE